MRNNDPAPQRYRYWTNPVTGEQRRTPIDETQKMWDDIHRQQRLDDEKLYGRMNPRHA